MLVFRILLFFCYVGVLYEKLLMGIKLIWRSWKTPSNMAVCAEEIWQIWVQMT